MLYDKILQVNGLTCTPLAVSHSQYLCIVRTARHAVGSLAKTQGIFADAEHTCVPLRDRLANGGISIPWTGPRVRSYHCTSSVQCVEHRPHQLCKRKARILETFMCGARQPLTISVLRR